MIVSPRVLLILLVPLLLHGAPTPTNTPGSQNQPSLEPPAGPQLPPSEHVSPGQSVVELTLRQTIHLVTDEEEAVDITEVDKQKGAFVFPPKTGYYAPQVDHYFRVFSAHVYTILNSNAYAVIPKHYENYGGYVVLIPQGTSVRISKQHIVSYMKKPGSQQLINTKEQDGVRKSCNKAYDGKVEENRRQNRRKQHRQRAQYVNRCYNKNIFNVGGEFVEVEVEGIEPVEHFPVPD